MRRHVQMRDRTCVAPGCRRPARKAQQDHTRDYQHAGATVAGNLEPLCLRHHRMKHEGWWRLDQLEPGRFRWRSPLGEIYWARGDPIAPDLPEPVPRAESDGGDGGTDGGGDNGGVAGRMVDGPIFEPRQPARPGSTPPAPPAESPPPRPPVDVDDLPPF